MEQLYEELRAMKRKYLTCTYILLACIVAGLAVLYFVGAIGLVFVAGAIAAGICAVKAQKEYSESYKTNVVASVLRNCGYISELRYAADEGVDEETVRGTGMMDMASTFDSGDFVCGIYKGIEFEQSDLHIQEEFIDSDNTHNYSSLFKGRWISLDGRADLSGRVQIVAKKFRAEKTRGLDRVKTENEEFDKGFRVFAENENDAFKMLDGNMMRSLIRLREKLDAPFMLMYVGGRLFVAVNDFKDAFEMNLRGKLDYESEKQRISDDMSVTTKVIDELAVYMSR